MRVTFSLLAVIGAVMAYDDPAPEPDIDITKTNVQEVKIPKAGDFDLLIDMVMMSLAAIPKKDTDVWDWYKGSDIA